MVLLIFSPPTCAEELTFEEAVSFGLENNQDLVEAREEIESIHWEFAELEAELGWEWETSAEFRKTCDNTRTTALKQLGSLDGERSFPIGFVLEPKFYLKEQEVKEEGLGREQVHFALGVEQPIYPFTETDYQRDYIDLERDLKEAEAELEEERRELLVDWLEDYLELIELTLEKEIEKAYLHLAKERLVEVEERYVQGEVDREELLDAKLELNGARQDIEGVRNDYREAERELARELRLGDQKIKVEVGSEFGCRWLEKVEEELPDLEDKEYLLELAKKNNTDLFINSLEKEELELERGWEADDRKPELVLDGEYEIEDEHQWQISLNLEALLYDSGEYRLEKKEFEQELIELKRERDNLLWELEADLDDLLGEIREEELELVEEQLTIEEEARELEAAYKDLEIGSISPREYIEAELDFKEAKLDRIEERHEVLVVKYELLEIIGGTLLL